MILRPSILTAAILLCGALTGAAGGVVHRDLPVAEDVTSAAFDYRSDIPAKSAKGVLVLVPGCNGNGAAMLSEPEWVDFARDNRLVLAAFSFVSDPKLLEDGDGYYDTVKGSGKIAETALRTLGPLPVLMYGFSGGAHFTASFAEHFPDRLAGWCAASFGQKKHGQVNADLPIGRAPPGIVACGADDPRAGKAVSYFHRGRELDRKWTWIEIPGLAHARHPALEGFVRSWFAALLANGKGSGTWVDIGSGEDVVHSATTAKTLRSWLPSAALKPAWTALSRQRTQGVIEHCVKLKAKSYPQITMFLRLPKGGDAPTGVLCLCVLAENPGEVREKIRDGKGGLFDFAERHRLAILGWGSRSLWDPALNWDELPRDRAKAIDETFDQVAVGWSSGVRWFAQRYGIPESGFLMQGGCGAGQFVQRLALRKPERFLAVHADIPGSFDVPTRNGKDILWCLTTGERLEGGYERSLKFFAAVRALHYPIVYKAYPGVSHMQGTAQSGALGRVCFEYALRQYDRATRLAGGRPARPDWNDLFASATEIADIANQRVFPVEDYSCIPIEYRMLLPDALKDAWLAE